MFYIAWWFQILRLFVVTFTVIGLNSVGLFPNNEHYWESVLGAFLGSFISITVIFNVFAFIIAVLADIIYVNNKFYQEWRKDHHPFWHKFTLSKENFMKNYNPTTSLDAYHMDDPRLN